MNRLTLLLLPFLLIGLLAFGPCKSGVTETGCPGGECEKPGVVQDEPDDQGGVGDIPAGDPQSPQAGDEDGSDMAGAPPDDDDDSGTTTGDAEHNWYEIEGFGYTVGYPKDWTMATDARSDERSAFTFTSSGSNQSTVEIDLQHQRLNMIDLWALAREEYPRGGFESFETLALKGYAGSDGTKKLYYFTDEELGVVIRIVADVQSRDQRDVDWMIENIHVTR